MKAEGKNLKFIKESVGNEVDFIREASLKKQASKTNGFIINKRPLHYLKALLKNILLRANPREIILKLLLGKEYEALTIGRFRLSGETHQWMYDGYSLGKLMNECGFTGITRYSAHQSRW